MRKTEIVKVILHLFLLLACMSFGFAADTTRENQEDDIREAVFRYQFDHNGSAVQTNAKAFFIGVGEKATNPSDEFLKHFAGNKPPVRKASDSQFILHKGISDKKTGEQGLAFRVTGIKWISDTEVEASGGYYEAELSSSGNTYTLKKENGKWKVTKNKMNWIS